MKEGQLSSLITAKLKTVTQFSQKNRRKAFTALLPYAIRLERDGQPEMFDAFLQATRHLGVPEFVLHHVEGITSLLHEATPRAIVLVSPSIPLSWLVAEEGSIHLWVAAVSAVQDTEGVAQSVVETLLRIASEEGLLRHITADVWSWLTKRPSPPLFNLGRPHRPYQHVVKVVRGLRDIETLKWYFLLVWSDGNTLPDDGFDETCSSLREDFGGVGMGHHRFDLTQRLDKILVGSAPRQLDCSFSPPRVASRDIYNRRNIRKKRVQYRGLKDVLLETNIEAISRSSYLLITLLSILTEVMLGSHETFMCALPLPRP